MIDKYAIPLELSIEIANMERHIAHMEADLLYHQSQVRLFEQKVREGQKELKILEKIRICIYEDRMIIDILIVMIRMI